MALGPSLTRAPTVRSSSRIAPSGASGAKATSRVKPAGRLRDRHVAGRLARPGQQRHRGDLPDQHRRRRRGGQRPERPPRRRRRRRPRRLRLDRPRQPGPAELARGRRPGVGVERLDDAAHQRDLGGELRAGRRLGLEPPGLLGRQPAADIGNHCIAGIVCGLVGHGPASVTASGFCLRNGSW